MHHYTYIIQSKTTEMRYIGVRSSTCIPTSDINYWGSSNYLPKDVKDTHIKFIIKEHNTRKEAIAHEVLLHSLNEVSTNPNYYNKAKQLTTGFDTQGVPMSVEAKDKISRATKGRTFTKQHLANIQKARTKNGPIVFSEEHKVNLSKAHKVYCSNPGYINPRKGKITSEETKAKISATKKVDSRALYIKSPRFSPWFITDGNITHLFYTMTKQEYALLKGVSAATYRNLTTKSKGITPISRGKYKGLIVGNIPTV